MALTLTKRKMSEILFCIEKGFLLKRVKNDKHWKKNKHRLCFHRNKYYWVPDFYFYPEFNFQVIHEDNVYYNTFNGLMKDIIIRVNNNYYKWSYSSRIDKNSKYYFDLYCVYNIKLFDSVKKIRNIYNRIIKRQSDYFYAVYGLDYGWRPL